MPPTICLLLKIIETSSKLYGICPNVNQVINILDAICIPTIMFLAQAVLRILCSKGFFWLNADQVIYNMLPICMLNIIILAQAVLQLFCSQSGFLYNVPKSEKGHNSAKYLQTVSKS